MTAPVYLGPYPPRSTVRNPIVVNSPACVENGNVFSHAGDPPEGVKLKMSARARGQLWSRLAERAETHQ